MSRALLFLLLLFPIVVDVAARSQEGKAAASTAAASPVADDQTAKDRRYAMELYEAGKHLEALPWLEKVVAAASNDAVATERLAVCLVSQSATLADPAQRKATRLRARQEFLRAQQLGDNSDLLQSGLIGLPEDGGDAKFSDNAEIDRLMKQGEAAFAAGKFDDAKNSYLQVVMLDPNYYEALLFIGDTYFRKGDSTAAGEWFARAVQVEPNRETAYRYWGDALVAQGKFAAAREKFIAAFLCNPYDQRAWTGIHNYLHAVNQKATWYKIQPKASFTPNEKGGGTVNIDPAALGKDEDGSAWISYPMQRALWKSEKFAQAYPVEKHYRHSLKEESAALSGVAAVAQEMSTGGKKPQMLSADLQALVSLQKAGLLDAYILLNAADAGIAQDYPEYLKAHREVLLRYLNEVVLPPPPPDRQMP